jgi:hypothetical protein
MDDTTPAINQSIEMDLEGRKRIELTLEDKERFFKSILADKPYQETVYLFDGQLAITFKSLTVQENSDIVSQIVADRKNGTASDSDAYMITVSSYRLALSLVSIEEKAFSTITRASHVSMDEKDTYVLARMKPLLAWTTPKLSVFLDAFQTFESKAIKLSAEVQTKNFWKASA